MKPRTTMKAAPIVEPGAKRRRVTKAAVDVTRRRTLDMEVEDTHSYQIAIGGPGAGDAFGVVTHNTLSLLGGVTPGCHPGIFKHYIRRVRMASDIPLVDICRRAGYEVEPQYNLDGTIDRGTEIPCFPCRYPDGTILAADMNAIAQMDVIRRLQREWSDNSVSCTVYYKKEELPGIRAYLAEHFRGSMKSISFMLHSDHGFKQAPYEEITAARYAELAAKCGPIRGAAMPYSAADDELAEDPTCAGGVCPIK